MQANRVVTCWDYHHGQSTRILVSGFPPVPGETMQEKQDYFQNNLDNLRAALCLEPRGHRNMLGAIITAPVNKDSLLGALFTSPHGYFDMCGDSSFSLGAYLVDSGIVVFDPKDTTQTVRVDTVAGTIELKLEAENGELKGVTIGNVPSRYLGTHNLDVAGHGVVSADLGYGGLVYAFVPASEFGITTLDFSLLDDVAQRQVIETGTALLEAARAAKSPVPIDLVVLTESVDAPELVSRVANFYAPLTMGRTPSGTGLSARLAVEHGKGQLDVGTKFSQESALGLQFQGIITTAQTDESGNSEIIPSLTAVSHLMAISQIIFKSDDAFADGFLIEG